MPLKQRCPRCAGSLFVERDPTNLLGHDMVRVFCLACGWDRTKRLIPPTLPLIKEDARALRR